MLRMNAIVWGVRDAEGGDAGAGTRSEAEVRNPGSSPAAPEKTGVKKENSIGRGTQNRKL